MGLNILSNFDTIIINVLEVLASPSPIGCPASNVHIILIRVRLEATVWAGQRSLETVFESVEFEIEGDSVIIHQGRKCKYI